eukprot:1588312-Prymnesium_polylepis.1
MSSRRRIVESWWRRWPRAPVVSSTTMPTCRCRPIAATVRALRRGPTTAIDLADQAHHASRLHGSARRTRACRPAACTSDSHRYAPITRLMRHAL